MNVQVNIVGNVGTGPTQRVQAGADTWASRTLISRDLFTKLGGAISNLRPPPVQLKAVGGRQIDAMGCIDICVNGTVVTEAYVLVDMGIPTPLLLGDPALRELSRGKQLQIKYHDHHRAEAFVGAAEDTEIIQTTDCVIRKNTAPGGKYWSYRWVWKDRAPPPLLDGVAIYRKRGMQRSEVDFATNRWIEEGILEPCPSPKVLVPINPVDQREKKPLDPVRITGDFKQLNQYIRLDMKEEDNEVCSEVIRQIRNHSVGTFLDLKSAYLSIHLDEDLRDYNAFKVGEMWYRGTRMLFGISPGQKVLLLVLKKIPGDRAISLRDDLFIPDKDKLTEVKDILLSNGFIVKGDAWSLENLMEGGSPKLVLGLCVFREKGELRWCRKPLNNISISTCRDFASVLGEGSGSHIPCVGPARAELSVFRSILGKSVKGDLKNWDSPVPTEILKAWDATSERLNRIQSYSWTIPKGIFRLYTDASGILCGGVLRVLKPDGNESDDILDFCSRNATRAHINIAELHAVVQGLKIIADVAPKGAEVHIIVDSKTAASWLTTCISHGIIRSGSMNKVLIRSRLEIIRQSIELMQWKVKVEWIETSKNPADSLTRVSKELEELWRTYNQEPADQIQIGEEDQIIGAVGTDLDHIRNIHEERLHPGLPAMSAICKSGNFSVTSKEIKRVIADCIVCQRKRPQPRYVNQKSDHPSPTAPWEWAQIDVLSLEEYKLILIIDEFSKSIEGRVIPQAPNSKEVIQLLEAWYARYSGILPRTWHLRSDRGREFYNLDVRNWVQSRNGYLHYGTARRPTANAMVERCNRTLLTLIRTARLTKHGGNVHEWVQAAINEYRKRPHSSLKWQTPSQVLFDRTLPPNSEVGEPDDEFPEDPGGEVDFEVVDSEIDEEEVTAEFQTPLSTDARDPPVEESGTSQFTVGDQVLVSMPNQKLEFEWTPAKVTQVGRFTAVTVQPEGHRSTTVNHQQVRKLPMIQQTDSYTGRPPRNRRPPDRLDL